MLPLCTSGWGFIMINICKQKIFTAYKKGISHRQGNALLSYMTGFPPITSCLYFTLSGSSKTKV